MRKVITRLLGNLTAFLDLAETGHGGTASDRCRGREGPGATRHDLAAGLTLALPDADGDALHGVLAAELASVLGAGLDFDLFAQLTESGTVTGTVLTGDPDLLGVLGHLD